MGGWSSRPPGTRRCGCGTWRAARRCTCWKAMPTRCWAAPSARTGGSCSRPRPTRRCGCGSGERADHARAQGHSGLVTACAFSPDGRMALSASTDNTLRLWDVARGQTVHVLDGHSFVVTACAFSPNGHLVALRRERRHAAPVGRRERADGACAGRTHLLGARLRLQPGWAARALGLLGQDAAAVGRGERPDRARAGRTHRSGDCRRL